MRTIFGKLLVIPSLVMTLFIAGCGSDGGGGTSASSEPSLKVDAADVSANSKTLFAQVPVVGVDTVFTVPRSGTLSVSQSFNGFYNGALGNLTIKNADGTDLVAPVCTGTAGQIKKCMKPYQDRLTLNPTSIEVLINGQVVVAAGQIPRTQGIANIAVPINTANTLQVNLAGPKGSYIQLTVTSENTPPLQDPIADFIYSPPSGLIPLSVSFDASYSSSPNGSIVSYNWDFGDGTTDTGVNPLHTYYYAGTYAVILTVIDSAGKSATKTVAVVADSR